MDLIMDNQIFQTEKINYKNHGNPYKQLLIDMLNRFENVF